MMKILDQSQMADFGSSQDSGGSVNSYRNVLKGSIFDINPSQLHISGSLGGQWEKALHLFEAKLLLEPKTSISNLHELMSLR